MHIFTHLKALGKTIVKRLHFNPIYLALEPLELPLLQNTINNILLAASGRAAAVQ